MKSENSRNQFGRRSFLRSVGVLALGAATLKTSDTANASGQMKPSKKQWRGLFPIAQTPFTPDNKLDLDCLATEVNFCNRGRVPGFVWPQGSSGWNNLSERERLEGAEAIMAAGKGGMTTLVIGVQAKGGDVNAAVRYAKHAAQHGADGIISMVPGVGEKGPPKKVSDQEVLDYYKAIGAATDLPLMIQSHGNMTVDLILEIYRQVPTVKSLKDEAGDPIARFSEFKRRTDNKLLVYCANGATRMIDAMRLGFDGYIPKTSLSDVSQLVFEMWNAGKHREAFDLFGRIQAFQTIGGAMQYLLTARGIFKETTIVRDAKRIFGPSGVTPSEAQKLIIREELKQFLGPYLQA